MRRGCAEDNILDDDLVDEFEGELLAKAQGSKKLKIGATVEVRARPRTYMRYSLHTARRRFTVHDSWTESRHTDK